MHKQHLYTFAWKIFCIRKSVVCRTRSTPSSSAAVPIYPARPVWHQVQTGAACPASGRVCRCAVSCVVCLASGAACAVQSVRVRWGLGSPPAGYTAAAQPRPVSLPTTEKIKKTHPTFTNQNPSDCASLQKFRKIQKDPSPSWHRPWRRGPFLLCCLDG